MTDSLTIDPQGHTQTVEVDISNGWFESREVSFQSVSIDGAGIIKRIGKKSIEAHVVLRYRSDGSLEEIGLTDIQDLREPRSNSFFVVEASELFNFSIDGHRFTWWQGVITAAVIAKLARKDPDEVDVARVLDDGSEHLLSEHDEVSVRHPGLERFVIKRAREVTISVNTKPVKIRRGRHTGAEIKETAIAQGVNIQATFTLSQELANGGSKIIGDKDPVRIKGGEEFLAVDDHDDSER